MIQKQCYVRHTLTNCWCLSHWEGNFQPHSERKPYTSALQQKHSLLCSSSKERTRRTASQPIRIFGNFEFSTHPLRLVTAIPPPEGPAPVQRLVGFPGSMEIIWIRLTLWISVVSLLVQIQWNIRSRDAQWSSTQHGHIAERLICVLHPVQLYPGVRTHWYRGNYK